MCNIKKSMEFSSIIYNRNALFPFFLAANASLERLASSGLSPNMIRYLMNEYHMNVATGNNVILLWSAATNFLPVLGAFIADSLLDRFKMIGLGSIFSLLVLDYYFFNLKY